MSKTYRFNEYDERSMRTRYKRQETFRCRRCKVVVGAIPCGGKERNHCPWCLYSRHVDGHAPGDRASACSSAMAPVGAFTRRTGEHVIVHRCLACGVERYNRIAADDDFDLVLRLPMTMPVVTGKRSQA